MRRLRISIALTLQKYHYETGLIIGGVTFFQYLLLDASIFLNEYGVILFAVSMYGPFYRGYRDIWDRLAAEANIAVG